MALKTLADLKVEYPLLLAEYRIELAEDEPEEAEPNKEIIKDY